MGLNEFFQSADRLLRTLTRPDWKTYWMSIKIVFAGIGLMGAIGYLVRLLAAVLPAQLAKKRVNLIFLVVWIFHIEQVH